MWETPSIKARRNSINPVLAMIFLITPAISAWAWQNRADQTEKKTQPDAIGTTQRLPVEIIVSDDDPKWVLVPIDPS